jgi:membrane fusion protein (multidrug efflux system)
LKQQLICAVLVSTVMALIGCSADTPSSAAAASPASVQSTSQPPISNSASASQSEEFIASGPIIVDNQLDVAAQRDGVVAEWLADTGTPVRKGQLLARLDDRQLTADRDAAKAQSDSIQADLKNWEATVKMAQADLDRSEKMWKSDLLTKEQLDHDRFKLTATQYEFDREQKNYQRSLAVAKSLDFELEKTRILAPFDGVVARRYVNNGQRVGNGDKLFWVSAISPLRVRFALAGKYAGVVKQGSVLDVIPADTPNELHRAKVVTVSPVLDPASGTIDVTAEMTGHTGSLKPGMMTNVRLQAAK